MSAAAAYHRPTCFLAICCRQAGCAFHSALALPNTCGRAGNTSGNAPLSCHHSAHVDCIVRHRLVRCNSKRCLQALARPACSTKHSQAAQPLRLLRLLSHCASSCCPPFQSRRRSGTPPSGSCRCRCPRACLGVEEAARGQAWSGAKGESSAPTLQLVEQLDSTSQIRQAISTLATKSVITTIEKKLNLSRH